MARAMAMRSRRPTPGPGTIPAAETIAVAAPCASVKSTHHRLKLLSLGRSRVHLGMWSREDAMLPISKLVLRGVLMAAAVIWAAAEGSQPASAQGSIACRYGPT